MSKLDELIWELCPDGVEFKRLDEIARINRGVRVVKSQLSESGLFPVFQNSMTPLGYSDKKNFSAGRVFMIIAGAAGEIGFTDIDSWAADDCLYFDCSENINDRYLYYILINNSRYFASQVRRASVPRLSRTIIEAFRIPIPPLPVQQEIVRILDNFTLLTAELTAELTARKKQYAYYRDSLLSFEIGQYSIEWKTLEEIFQLRNGYTPSRGNKEYWENGTIPWFRMDDIRTNGNILEDSIQHISSKAVKRDLFPANSILLATSATVGEHALIGW